MNINTVSKINNYLFAPICSKKSKILYSCLTIILFITYLFLCVLFSLKDEIVIGLIFGFTIFLCFFKKYKNTITNTNFFLIYLGLIITLGLVLLIKMFNPSYELFVCSFPLIGYLGIVIATSKVKNVKEHWQAIFLLFILAFPFKIILTNIIDFEILTAKFVYFFLNSLGNEVSIVQNVNIVLPNGGVKVYEACSGVRGITRLLQIMAVPLMTRYTSYIQKIALLFSAIFIGFFSNGLKIALLAILASSNQPDYFKYWHEENGAHIFSLGSLLFFGAVCYFLNLKVTSKKNIN
jgi:cyanoexosortase A